MASSVEGHHRVGTMSQLRVRRCIRVDNGDHTIAVFYHDGKVNAVYNRCPHSGYPLETGTVKDGVVTCIWHQARFELATGASQDPEIDDILTYPVTIVDDEVWVGPEPNPGVEPD